MIRRISVIAAVFTFCLFGYASAETLQGIQKAMLAGDYLAVLSECDMVISASSHDNSLDAAYYYRGLSKLRLGQVSSARSDFEYIIDRYPESAFSADARTGIGDTYFSAGDYESALAGYKATITDFPDTDTAPVIYGKMARTAALLKRGGEAELYKSVIGERYPLSLENMLLNDGAPAEVSSETDGRYSIQVGSFGSKSNAKKLADKLKKYGYNAYVSETSGKGKAFYRVRIGKFSARPEAYSVKERLGNLGYPTQFISE
ncbi:MAG: hypothetical protein AUJ75_04455 [Candidatus Omnitrophica bacterium CG1_02_49_10]|nr:MAG: hypothetical protein AUJ75_04455 [Candidatus Omnitrophica bacterium CG1_02_49_10]